MKKTWQIALLIAAGFVLGIMVYISTHNPDKNNLPTANNMTQPVATEIIREGSGAEIKNGQTAIVHYVGTLENGTKFDSSRDRNNTFSFTLGEGKVIRGWEVGVLGMKVGEIRKLTIQPEYGYGEYGAGGVIPPNAVLIFEIELIGIN